MSGYLQYSNYGDENETPINRKVSTQSTQSTQSAQPDASVTKPTQQKRILRTSHRTLRSRPEPGQPGQQQQPQQQHKYVQELIQKIHSYEDGASDAGDDDDDNNYAPLASAPSSNNSIHQQFQTESSPNRNRFPGANSADLNAKWNPAPAKEAFTLNAAAAAVGTLAKPPFNQPYVPSVFQASDTDGANKDILLQKLDHIISLLENQQDEKTGHVTEELVLYCFLGVFIIFLVDSFARAGKYVR